jgi:3-deoxy-D-manno-octulosonic-acid transferase
VPAVLRVLYAAVAQLVSLGAAVVPAGQGKTRMALRARHGIRERYARWGAAHRDRARKLVWMHAPSVGEGLQARPVLRLLRDNHPELQLAYTFFSPSAEEFSRGLDVDFRDYLPFDTGGDMAAALQALRPDALVFSKLDVWPELVRRARAAGVPLGMVSATLAEGSGRRGFLAKAMLRDAYAALDAVGAVSPEDAERLVELGVRREVVEVTGDTRFDQVAQRAEAVDRGSPLLGRLDDGRPTLVAGSTWPADESRLLPAFERARGAVPNLRLIIAPHEMTPAHLAAVESWASQARLRLARIDAAEATDADVILVDRFGLLGDLYALASVAFVGGGFHDAGLHSVLEPAAFGAPVLFGPKHTKSRDASLLIAAGGARAVVDVASLAAALELWGASAGARGEAGNRARTLVQGGRGAAERSTRLIQRLLSA